MANITLLGASYSDVPSVKLPQQGGGVVSFDDTTDATATAEDIAQGKTAYVNGSKVVGTASGGSAVIEPLSVTANGTYSAPSGVDGYSPVTVNVSGGGGGDHDSEDAIVKRTISGVYENSRVTSIGSYAFANCSKLTTVSFPNVTSIWGSAFQYCRSLTTADFPKATSIGSYAFNSCSKLATVSFPNVTSIGSYAFYYCGILPTASFPNATTIGNGAFQWCTSLTTASFPMGKSFNNQCFRYCSHFESLYVLASSVATLGNSAFLSTPMSLSSYLGHFGSIYVPASLVDAYKTASNWSVYADRITAYEE